MEYVLLYITKTISQFSQGILSGGRAGGGVVLPKLACAGRVLMAIKKQDTSANPKLAQNS